MATLPAERRDNPIQVIRQNLTQLAPEFKAALPSHVSVEKFSRVAMTAIQNNPDLQGADRRSLFGSIVRLAQDGLLPDGREAALVIFNTKNKSGGWDKKVQAMPMIAGVLKKIRQSGEVAKVSAQVVYENDHFLVKYGFDEDVEHIPPSLDKPRGKPIGAYATAVLKDGSQMLEVMSLEEIQKVRNVSKAKDRGPWVDWFEEMARKTVMRRLSKRLPMSTDLEEQVFARDETMTTKGLTVIEQDTREPEPTSRLEALESQIADDGDEYEEVGEDDPNDGTLAPDNPTAAEGPADEDRGEAHSDDETPAWHAKVESIRAGIAASKNKQHVKSFDDEFTLIRAGLPDEVIAELDALIAAKRRELSRVAEDVG